MTKLLIFLPLGFLSYHFSSLNQRLVIYCDL